MRRELRKTPQFVRAAKRVLKQHAQMQGWVRETLRRLAAGGGCEGSPASHPWTEGETLGIPRVQCGYVMRIVFQIVEHEGEDVVLLVPIGTHEEAY